MTMMTENFIKKYINIDLILNDIFYEYNKLDHNDENKFAELSHYHIDIYVTSMKHKKNIKKLIDKYGILNAIKLYDGDFNDLLIYDETQKYQVLACIMIGNYIIENLDEIDIKYLKLQKEN